ncbi:MAG: PQQ-like beta-propeller repeat protein, partial [Planctomycetaceae bacterium]|nr:PQQ-like beta-propeller repeat protein [Planctomycetaceae bacterium]
PTTVFVTGTVDEQTEVVIALDRSSGKEIWRAQWPGALKVPFFAASNGSWIRATPVLDGDHLYVAGIRDVLVALNASTGAEEWRIDFVTELGSPLPAFGFVSSPLVDGDSIYVQAGASVLRLNKTSGKIIWRSLEDSGGMMGSAFSSPVMADLGGRRQLIVQTREKLAGLDPETGSLLWEQVVPSFRGMNILTPVVHDQGIFTSSYQNKSWLYAVAETANGFQVSEAWSNNAQGYMSTPIVINDHAYLHLQNERFTCIDLRTGQRTWTSETFGKYCSLVAQHDRILALDEHGELLLIQADPDEFKLIDRQQVCEEETWAHLAVCGDEVFVRHLNGILALKWTAADESD